MAPFQARAATKPKAAVTKAAIFSMTSDLIQSTSLFNYLNYS
jgi:hypothetical protein